MPFARGDIRAAGARVSCSKTIRKCVAITLPCIPEDAAFEPAGIVARDGPPEPTGQA